MGEVRYTVSLRKSEEGYSAWIPGLPGCASQGDTEREALDNIRDAIKEYLAVADELAGSAGPGSGSGSSALSSNTTVAIR